MKLGLPCIVLLILMAAVSSVTQGAVSERYVVLPFANETGEESLYWMGEALAIGLTDHLLAAGVEVVETERRRAALLEMGLDGSEPVTLASALLMGRRLGAEVIILGQYGLLEDHGVLIGGRTVHDAETRQGHTGEVRGSLSDLHRLQQKLVADLVPDKRIRGGAGNVALMKAVEQTPLSSLEMYARAMATEELEAKRDLLSRSLESDPLYPAALMERARLEIDAGRPESAFLWLDRIPLETLVFPERYWRVRGDAAAAAGDRGSAVDHYEHSLAVRPRATTYFQLAAVLAKQGKLMDARGQVDAGLTLDPRDPYGIELREALAHSPEPSS